MERDMDPKTYAKEMLAFQSLSDREFIQKLRESVSEAIQMASKCSKLITDGRSMLAKFEERDLQTTSKKEAAN
jgi:hypothetical protein